MNKATIAKGLAFTAVGGLLAAACGGDDKQANSANGAAPAPAGAKDCCKGKNTCAGKGGCATDKNPCMGKNTCAKHMGCNKHCQEKAPAPAASP